MALVLRYTNTIPRQPYWVDTGTDFGEAVDPEEMNVGTGVRTALAAAVNEAGGISTVLTPYDAGTLTASASFNVNNGRLQKATMGAFNVTTLVITNGVFEGSTVELWIKGHASTNYTLTTAYAIPSDSLLTLPKTIVAAKTYILRFKYIASAWRMITLEGGY